MDSRLRRMLQDELRIQGKNSVFISKVIHNLEYTRDMSEFVTIIAQGLVQIDSARQELFDVLVERKKLGL